MRYLHYIEITKRFFMRKPCGLTQHKERDSTRVGHDQNRREELACGEIGDGDVVVSIQTARREADRRGHGVDQRINRRVRRRECQILGRHGFRGYRLRDRQKAEYDKHYG